MQRNMGWSRVFDTFGAQEQEHLIDPFKGSTCHLQGIEPGWGG